MAFGQKQIENLAVAASCEGAGIHFTGRFDETNTFTLATL
jgi:hypothetical protein